MFYIINHGSDIYCRPYKINLTRCNIKRNRSKMSTTHKCHTRNNNPINYNQRRLCLLQLSRCHPCHPSNGRYLFPNPLSVSSSHPPPRARPRLRGTARVRMNPHPQTGGGAGLAEEAEEFEVKRITKG